MLNVFARFLIFISGQIYRIGIKNDIFFIFVCFLYCHIADKFEENIVGGGNSVEKTTNYGL
jgi:hypothetical protein